jgi:class 3 adenylate cyclase
MKGKSIRLALVGDVESLSIQYYLFNLSCVVFAALGLFFGIENFLAGNALIAIGANLPGECFIILAYILARRRKDFRPYVFLLWLTMFLTNTPIWIMQAGSVGSAIYPVFAGGPVLLVLSSTRWRMPLLALLILYVAGLLAFEYFLPGSITAYRSRDDRYFDITITILPSLLVVGLVVSFYVKNYNSVFEALGAEKKKTERLIGNIRKYLPFQLVEALEKADRTIATAPQRRRITVFFSDIKDFTPTTDAMEPEDLTALMNEYLTEMTNIATKHGGTIDKFVGDAMMVIFGAPIGIGEQEDAVNCVRMAIEMQDRMKTLQANWYAKGIERPLQVRIGINTGIATVGDFGAHDRLSYTAIGGQVNLAARLEAVCPPGGVVISHSTWGLVKGAFECHKREESVALKGIPRDVTIYDVLL